MNTDHINYQQQIAQSVNEEKDQEEILDNSDHISKQQQQPSSSTSIGINQNLSSSINNDYQRVNQNSENNTIILTPIERRQRIFTLIIIALIALLTGMIHHFK